VLGNLFEVYTLRRHSRAYCATFKVLYEKLNRITVTYNSKELTGTPQLRHIRFSSYHANAEKLTGHY